MIGLVFPSLTAIWGLASGAAMIALGATTLRGGASRPRGSVAFGALAVIWGVQVALGGGVVLARGSPFADLVNLTFLVFVLPLPYLLVEFAATQDTEPRGVWHVARAIALLVVTAAVAVLFLDPSLLYVGATASGAPWGPWFPPLVFGPFFAAFGVALLALLRAAQRSPTPRTRERTWPLLAGLGVYAAFAVGNNLAFYGLALLAFGPFASASFYTPLFALLALAVGYTIFRLARPAGHAHPVAEARKDRRLALVLSLVFVWGVVEAALAIYRFPFLETVGLWRLAGVGVIAYGLARWRVADLPRRTAHAAATAGGAGAALAGGVAAFGAGTLVASTPAVPAIAAVIVVSASLLPSIRLTRRLFAPRARPQADVGSDLYGERVDAYRAALEASVGRGTMKEDERFLQALRDRFELSDDEHRLLLHLARSSVVVHRGKDAWEAYERLRLLGEGGAGRTWLARDRTRDRLVVLKEPLDHWMREGTAREAVLREARLAAKVRHANVVEIEEVVEGKGAPVIVMEYLEGGSLAHALRQRGTLPWTEAADLAIDLLRGLEAIHAAGIVHRDVKPSNVLLDANGSPKVADFGIALPQSDGRTKLDANTFTGAAAGTLAYMAPEVRAGRPADRRSDVYSAAALLHECLYGSPPGPGLVVVADPGRVPPQLVATLARALADRPEARFPTARAFAEELGKLRSA